MISFPCIFASPRRPTTANNLKHLAMNNKITLIILVFLSFWSFKAQGQCPTSSNFFNSQDSINVFPTNYPNCHTFVGDISIQGNDITSLANLSQITSITGDFTIFNCDQLPTLTGLNNIQSIGKELNIYENDLLTSLDGLNNLQNITGSLTIRVNKQLQSLSSLANLSTVGHITSIIDNDNLVSITGLENLTTIGPGLIIGGNDKLPNLNGINNITNIDGPLVIAENYSLTSISALSQLTTITDSLNIRSNYQLTSLDGLQNVTTIGSKVKIEGTAITDLTGLGNITTIHDSLIIQNNAQLTSLQGLSSLTDVDHLKIAYCPNLTSLTDLSSISHFKKSILVLETGIPNLSGFDNITTVHGDLAINYNGQLQSFHGLENLQTIEGFFAFRNDTLLNDITALKELDSVLGDFVFIADNPSLETLNGLDNLYFIGGSAIDIHDNPSLTFCGVPSICYQIQYASYANIFNNSPGCNTTSEVESTCGGAVIQGLAFHDANNNCQLDTNETPLPNWPILVIQGTDTLIDYTDNFGGYKIFTSNPGTYQVTSIPPLAWTETCTGTTSVTLTSSQDVATVHFYGQPDTVCPALLVDITTGHLAPCEPTIFKVNYCNNGANTAPDAKIAVKFTNAVTINSSPIPYTPLGDHTYLFDIGDVHIGECHDFDVTATISCDAIDQQAICAYAKITPDNLCLPPSNLWSKASLAITGECATDSIRFTIKNTGTGNMLNTQTYDIIIDDWVVLKTGVKLDAGGSTTLAFPLSDSTYTLRGSQVPHHPGNSRPLISLEGCATNASGIFSTGYVLQYPEDDIDPFVSIDCQEIDNTLPASNQQNFPKGYGFAHYIVKDQPIEYKINFHNTSSDTLRNMVIKEAVSPYLDLTKLQLGAKSHPYDLKIINDTMIFHISDINMPPSATDFVHSFGFVKFKLTPKENLASGTVIKNTAFLHYGPTMAIETNEVYNTIGDNFIKVGIFSVPHHISIETAPNPFTEYTTFNFDGLHFKSAQISIFDQLGRTVRQETFHQSSFTLYKKDLKQGNYSFEILFDNNTKANGKITVFQ